jgi:hypothetical protein
MVWTCKSRNHHYSCRSGWTNRQAMSNIKDNLALSLPKTQERMLMRSMPASIAFVEDKLARRQQGLGWQMPMHHDMHPHINRCQKLMEVYRQCLIRSWPWSQDNIPKSLKMKLLCKYQWGSFLDNQDDCRITYKRRRTTLYQVVRQSRRNLSSHP